MKKKKKNCGETSDDKERRRKRTKPLFTREKFGIFILYNVIVSGREFSLEVWWKIGF